MPECSQCGACSSQRFLLLTCILLIIYKDIGHALLLFLKGRAPWFNQRYLCFGLGCPKTRVKHTATVISIFNSISFVRNALLHASYTYFYVHACGVGTAVWCSCLFVLECSLRLACFSCVLVWLSPSVGVGTAWYGTWHGTVGGVARFVICYVSMV